MKKTWKVGVSALMAVLLLAGCGANNGNTNTGTTGEGSASGKTVTLKMFIGLPRFKDQFDKYIDQFVAKQKAEKNIDVKVQLEMPSSDNASQILKTRLASNDAPDIYSIHAINEIPSFYRAGYLEDLSNQPFVDRLLDSVKPAVTIDNKIVALPLETQSWGYLYNKKIFNDLNLKVPTTLSEMKQVVETLQKNNIAPFELAYKEAWIPQLFLPLNVGAQISAGNKDFIERMNKNEGSFTEMKSMFDIIDLVNANGTPKALEAGGDDGAAAFANGKAAMWVQGPWYAETILKANPDIDFGIAPLPIDDNPDHTLINLGASTSLVVSPTSKNKEVALDFLNYMLDDKDSSALFESLKFDPVIKSHTYETYPWVKDAQVYVKENKAYRDPSIPQAVKDEVGKGLQSYFSKQMSQDDVLKALDKPGKTTTK